MAWSAALQGFLTGGGLIVAIGAQNAFVLRQGLKKEFVLPVVLLCIFGDVLMISLGIAGVGVAIAAWPLLMGVFRYGGAAFLTVYGLQAFLRAKSGGGSLEAAAERSMSLREVVLLTLGFTFLNPHAYLDTLVLIGSIASAQPEELRIAFGAGACSASVLWFFGLGFGARLLRPIFRNPTAWRILDGVIALVMWSIALSLVLEAF